MNLYGPLIGDEAHHIVAGNRTAAVGKHEVALLVIEFENVGFLGVNLRALCRSGGRCGCRLKNLLGSGIFLVAAETETEEARNERAGAASRCLR